MEPGEVVGRGALFEVRRLREDGRDLVEKRLLPRVRREPLARAALAREAHVLTRARHRALPELVRVGSGEQGPFLIESFVAGASIRRVVDSWSSRGGVPPRLLSHVVRQAFAALAELAELTGPSGPLGLVHGDLTPDHVVLGPDGDVSFVDLGSARIAGLPPELLGEDRGTLPFAAPEVARGDAAPGARSDIYSLAATALHVLTGGGPICAAREAAAMLAEIGTHGVRSALFSTSRALGPREREALAAALSVDPGGRPASAREVVAAFDDAWSTEARRP